MVKTVVNYFQFYIIAFYMIKKVESTKLNKVQTINSKNQIIAKMKYKYKISIYKDGWQKETR